MKSLEELAEEARKREDYLRRLEAIPTPKKKVVLVAPEKKAPFVGLCKVCFEPIRFDDHGTCRKCRARISRVQENKKIHQKLKQFGMLTTESVDVDTDLRQFFPLPRRV